MDDKKYIVVSTCGAEESIISGKGVTGIWFAETLEQAQQKLDEIVVDWFFGYIGFTMQKNTPYGDDFSERDSIKHSSYFWGSTMAWIRANLEDWERIEILEYDYANEKYVNHSIP